MSSGIIAKTPVRELNLLIESSPNKDKDGILVIDEQLTSDEADDFFIQQCIKSAIDDFNPNWIVGGFRHNDERGTTNVLVQMRPNE